MNKSIIPSIAVIAVAVLLSVGISAYLHGGTKEVQTKPGSIAGPDIPSPYLKWGGVAEFRGSMALAATSSVPCSIQNPANATSTMNFFYVNVATSTITDLGIAALGFDISTSSIPFGSSTPSLVRTPPGSLGVIPAATTAGTPRYISWQPTAASTTNANVLGGDRWATTGENPFVLGPKEYVNFRIATGTAGVFGSYLTGTCGMSVISPL